jgi:hypothetical protein
LAKKDILKTSEEKMNRTKIRKVDDDLLDMNALSEELIFIIKSKYYPDKLIKTEEQAIKAIKKEILIRQENWYRD